MSNFLDLTGKIVLITGGANGIGAAMVKAFTEQDAQVCFCDIDAVAGKAVCAKNDGKPIFRKVDLLREKQVNAWIAGVVKKFGRVDVLINNAACDPRIALNDMSVQDWDTLLARNLRSCFLTSRAANEAMPIGASIINFSSITFHIAPPEMTAYVASKGGIISFTRSLARELGPRGIRVNTISPGWIMTDRQLKQFVTPKVKRMLRERQCMPELIKPAEIANVALFLASHLSSAVTGQEILADRGWQHS
jgi:NAD(P)-dependent dehydrogenase (short-subunit alcohol dehydrogenase family)